MTREQYGSAAHVPSIKAESLEILDDQHHAHVEKTTMSSHGPFEYPYSPSHRLNGEWIVQADEAGEGASRRSSHTGERVTMQTSQRHVKSEATQTIDDESYTSHRPSKRARISFDEFAAQAQLQQYNQRRKQVLRASKRVLQKSIALSVRLRRTSSWVQDGLVEISRHQDAAGFARVFSHNQDLIDVCYSYWNNERQNLDTMQLDSHPLHSLESPSFFDQLPAPAQDDFMELLSNLRSNPRFLIDRLRSLPLSQVATLTAKPKWQVSEHILTSLSQSSGGSAQRRRRVQAFSKELEDYATSFGRSDPLSFLLHNVYSHDTRPDSPESQLRLSTWSTVCATLLKSGSESYGSFYWQALEAFSGMDAWPAKRRVELSLMDVLQRGAFLTNENSPQKGKSGHVHLNTSLANEFFDAAVTDLYCTLIECGVGCFPTGALALAQAILDKLPEVQLQGDFRMHFFQKWYLNHFLKAAIMFPENENMLLNVHISRRARENILAPLFNRFSAKFDTLGDDNDEIDENVHNILRHMINMLDGKARSDPYLNNNSDSPQLAHGIADLPMLAICASEVVKVLEILSPQSIHAHSTDPVVRMIGHAFDETYSRPSTRFDILKQELLRLVEPGTSAKDIHPCSENWAAFYIQKDGRVTASPPANQSVVLQDLFKDLELSLPQQAALRSCRCISESGQNEDAKLSSYGNPDTNLAQLFQRQIEQCQASARTADAVYWRRALVQLRRQYPLVELADDDTTVLSGLQKRVISSKDLLLEHCNMLEEQLGPYQEQYSELKRNVEDFTRSLEEMRLKLWYTSEIVNSPSYTDARNVAVALVRMSATSVPMTVDIDASSKGTHRPSSGSSRLAPLSLFGQPQDDMVDLLKAPTKHGGPRKLADDQVESVKQWLQQYGVDNLCKGEERLHRFCMEISLLARRLTGENIMESSELWSSDLFLRERSYYDFSALGINSAPASTRPASVFSEAFSASSTYSPLRPALRSLDSDVRSTISDDRSSRRGSVYGLFQRSLNPQLMTPSLASSIGSYGRGSSATTAASDIFSQASQSVTSTSVYSRPPSILYGSLPNFAARPANSLREKKKFRDETRKGLICLLLSDLGTIIFGAGCETDNWIQNNATDAVMSRLQRRLAHNSLMGNTHSSQVNKVRRQSASEAFTARYSEIGRDVSEGMPQISQQDEISYSEALRDTLIRLSQQFDPVRKLQACHDFHNLAIQQLAAAETATTEVRDKRGADVEGLPRRNSVETGLQWDRTQLLDRVSQFPTSRDSKASEAQIVQHLKCQLVSLRPESSYSIFRDLQYIAAFVPSEMLDKTSSGKAFMDLSMAAMDYKNDLCASMVDVADQVVATDSSQRKQLSDSTESLLPRAAEYWKSAALNGNRVAQRELANLYLLHPETVPVITTPLSTSSEVFKDDMMWQKKVGNNNSRQALCLALHWMQQAARQGDKIALRRLQERAGGLSIR